MKTMSLPERPATSNDTTEWKQSLQDTDSLELTEQQLSQMSVREKLMHGITVGLKNELARHTWVEQMTTQDALSYPNGPLDNSMTVERMQLAVDNALHVSHLLEPTYVERENVAIWGHIETVHHDLTIKGPGKGLYLRDDRRVDRKQRAIHMQNRLHFV